MSRRIGTRGALRREVLARDGHRCVKCGQKSRLEAHHVIPVVFGGQDELGNLVTLCASCHKVAPDEPAQFFRWAASGLPPSMDLSKHLTKLCVSILFHRERLGEKIGDAEKLIDEIYPDLWSVFRAKPTEEDPFRQIVDFKKLALKYLPPESGSS